MTMRTTRLTAALCLSLAFVGSAVAQGPNRNDAHGDPLPDGARARLGTLRWRHAAGVLFVSFTADGKQLLSASQDGTLRLWEADTGKEIRRFGKEMTPPNLTGGPVDGNAWMAYNRSLITSAALTPDGKLAVSCVQDGTVNLWDTSKAEVLRSFKPSQAGMFSVAFTPDGKQLLTLSHDQVARLFDVAEGKEIRKFNEQPANQPRRLFFRGGPGSHASFSADGATLFIGAMELEGNRYNAVVKRWEVATGKELDTIKGPQGGYQSLAFAPDGKTFIWGDNTGAFRVWDVATAKELRNFGAGAQGGFANSLAYSPDGKLLASRSWDQTIRIWDIEAGKELKSIPGQQQNNMYGGFVQCNLAFSPDGKFVAAGAGGNSVGQWEVATGKARDGTGGHHGPVFTLALSADGSTAVTRAADNTVHVWDTIAGKETNTLALPATSTLAAFSADGSTLALGAYDGTLRLWDVKAGKEIREWKAPQTQNVFAGMNGFVSIALSPDGKLLASRGTDQMLRLWDTTTAKELRQISETPGTTGNMFFAANGNNPNGSRVAFSPDGSLVAVLPMDGSLIELNTGRQTPLDQGVRLWDVATGRLARRLDSPKSRPQALAFTRDGRTLATGNADSTITLWEVASGKERFSFKSGAAGVISTVAFSPDGKTLSAAGQGQTVGFWDALTGNELAQMKGHQGAIVSLAYATDGKTLLSGGWDTTGLVWDLPERKVNVPTAELNAQQLDALWGELANPDAHKAYDALRGLLATPKQTTALFQERCRPVDALDPQRVAQLFTDLESNVFITRKRATDGLETLGELVEPELKAALATGPSLETRQRVERLIEKLESGQAPASETLRSLRAVEVLEHVGTPEARQVLDVLTHGAAGARLTRQAKASLERLGKQ